MLTCGKIALTGSHVPYLLIAALLTGFGAGYGLSYKISQAAISDLQADIASANASAGLVLNDSIKRVDSAKDAALAINNKLDQAHDNDLNTIVYLQKSLSSSLASALSVKLHPASADQGCPNPLPARRGAVQHSENATDRTDLSKEFTELVAAEALRADLCAVDKNTLLSFVNANCGISQQKEQN